MVGRVAPGLQENLLKLLIHVSEGRGEDAAAMLRQIAPPGADFDPAALNLEVTRLVSRHRDAGLRDLNVGRSVLLLDHHARRHGLHPPPRTRPPGQNPAPARRGRPHPRTRLQTRRRHPPASLHPHDVPHPRRPHPGQLLRHPARSQKLRRRPPRPPQPLARQHRQPARRGEREIRRH